MQICKQFTNFVANLKTSYIFIVFLSVLLTVSCQFKNQPEDGNGTPWSADGTALPAESDIFTLSDIVNGGEMIVATLSGPDTYYEHRGSALGTHYLLCERFAHELGVSVRVVACKDTAEMVQQLQEGRADLIAFPLPMSADTTLTWCGQRNDSLRTGWAVLHGNSELARALNEWYSPKLLADVENEQHRRLTTPAVKRHVYAPFLNRQKGEISQYDALFRKHAATCRWDWRLLAAQCYQESTFDPQARSWAGARGLMQIMPATAATLNLSMDDIHKPEPNIEAATKLIKRLTAHFADIPSATERQKFVLAAYNAGEGHVRDAMALTVKNGHSTDRWAEVAQHMMLLKQPEYYRDPVVKHGYMRSDETVQYVERILQRYEQYGGARYRPNVVGGTPSPVAPRKAQHKNRFKNG